jgi:hypothetical protein
LFYYRLHHFTVGGVLCVSAVFADVEIVAPTRFSLLRIFCSALLLIVLSASRAMAGKNLNQNLYIVLGKTKNNDERAVIHQHPGFVS